MNKRSGVVFILGMILLCFAESASGQWFDPEKVNKKVLAINETAYQEAREGKYKESITHLTEALKLDPRFVDGYLSRAGIYAETKNYKSAVADFETGFNLDSI